MSRRFRYIDGEVVEVSGGYEPVLDRPIMSETLGFGQHQWEEMEADRKMNGFSGVEFVRDPAVPEFYNVKCGSRAEHERYVRHRGFVNKTGIGGVRLTREELDAAASLITRSIEERKHGS